MIRSADKSGSVAVQNKEAYRTEILRQLSNSQFYIPLTCDPTVKFIQEVNSFLCSALNDNFIDEPISQYIDLHIKPLVAKLPSLLKDTTDFLNKRFYAEYS